ncbi:MULTISPECIES: hypothetical protein [unclassified Paenibacillus]|uniref:hypothetical protein n=1 Tax=unclassified Paenibacillus TaxID=185978 RepID=UPI000837F238|nr:MULTISPECIES: hypothetical protein [unclassified Paenibacillus]
MKSPGGSTFPYYYKGGEIHCLKYGNKYKDEQALLQLMRKEEEFIVRINRRLKIWVDFDKTSFTPDVCSAFIQNIIYLSSHIDKLSIVGLSGFHRWRLQRGIRKAKLKMSISFYMDPEEAKTWLISEGVMR